MKVPDRTPEPVLFFWGGQKTHIDIRLIESVNIPVDSIMKLQEKVLVFFVFLLIAVLVVTSLFFSTILLANYSTLEERYTEKDLSQAVNKLHEEYTTLSAIVSDWGPWDDTYNYVTGNKPDYLRSNLQQTSYDNLNVNLIVIANSSGHIVYAGAFDLGNRTVVQVPAFFSKTLDPAGPLMNMSDPHASTAGILMLADNPMIIASQPISRSDFSGPPQGVVIMGKYLDKPEIARLATLTSASLEFTPVSDPGIPRDFISRIQSAQSSTGLIVRQSEDQITGAALIVDIYGNDALVMKITEPREIYRQGKNTTMEVLFLILLIGICVGLLGIFLLDRFLFTRMGSLADQVHTIGRSENLKKRVEIGGDDELSGLAGEINRMLDTLEITRKNVEASETRFRELTELLPQIIFEMDTGGNLLYVNKAGTRHFGITGQMIRQGINIRAFLSPDAIEQMRRGLAAVLGGSPSPGEVYSLVKPDGTPMKAIVSTSLEKNEGRITGFRGIVVDITEQTRLREELEEKTKLLTGILQATPVGVFQLDATGHIIYVNDTFTKITGIASETIQGTYWADIISRVEYDRLSEQIDRSIWEQKTTRIEFRFIHPDGTPYWLFGQTVPILAKNGTLNGWVGTITDITGQKLIEDALSESEEKYRALTENTPDILFSTDMAGEITYVSPQVNKYGFLEEEVVGKSLRVFIHPADVERVESNLSRELKEGAQFVSRFRILDKWGTVFWFEEKSSLRLDLSGKPVGIYGIMRDVTERKRVEDAIELANKKLNLMNQITRHDILNTITGLLGCVDMAKASHSLTERDGLLNDIRDLTRIIQRHIAFTKEYQEVGVHMPQWQNANDLVVKILQNFEKTSIRFSADFTRTEIYADPLLEKVFYNLVDNAIRYGETITTITIYMVVSEKELSLVFEDDGVGVEPLQKREIFKRGVGKNTGLGLFLTAEILSITGISIEENGTFGKGARFEIHIPNGTWRYPRE
jgi:PAS domain S-box-containing protein